MHNPSMKRVVVQQQLFLRSLSCSPTRNCVGSSSAGLGWAAAVPSPGCQEKSRLRGVLSGFERHFMSQFLQPSDELTGRAIRFETIQEVGPQLDVGGLVLQHVIDDRQQRMAQRHDRTLLPPPRRQAVVLRRQVRPLV